MIYSPVVAFVLVIHMLMSLINHDPVTVLWYLYFGLSFVVMMIIPGHILIIKLKTMFKELDPFIAFPTPASGDVHFTIGGGGGVCLYQGEDERYRRKSQRPIGQT